MSAVTSTTSFLVVIGAVVAQLIEKAVLVTEGIVEIIWPLETLNYYHGRNLTFPNESGSQTWITLEILYWFQFSLGITKICLALVDLPILFMSFFATEGWWLIVAIVLALMNSLVIVEKPLANMIIYYAILELDHWVMMDWSLMLDFIFAGTQA